VRIWQGVSSGTEVCSDNTARNLSDIHKSPGRVLVSQHAGDRTARLLPRKHKPTHLGPRPSARISGSAEDVSNTIVRKAELSLQIDASNRQGDENGELAAKVFELSQALSEKWVEADIPEKRRLLEIVCLNFSLEGTSLIPTMRNPFDMVAEGLLTKDGSGAGFGLHLAASCGSAAARLARFKSSIPE